MVVYIAANNFINVLFNNFGAKLTFLSLTMANALPAYVVRNLVDSALGRSDNCRKPLKTQTGREMCVVSVPSEGRSRKTTTSKDIKALLKLHKRFEIEALRNLNKGVVVNVKDISPQVKQVHSQGFVENRQKTNKNDEYFKDISSKLEQLSSPPLTTNTVSELLGNECQLKQPGLSQGSTPKALTFPCGCTLDSNMNIISPYTCPNGYHGNDTSSSTVASCQDQHLAIGNAQTSNLQQGLTIIPLTSETFAAYDALPTFVEDDPRYEIGNARQRSDLIPVFDAKSEDALSVHLEKYLDDITSCFDDVGEPANDVGDDALALVEYKPRYQKSVHFSEDLHEVHLYSPVQDHRGRRKRDTNSHTIDCHTEEKTRSR